MATWFHGAKYGSRTVLRIPAKETGIIRRATTTVHTSRIICSWDASEIWICHLVLVNEEEGEPSDAENHYQPDRGVQEEALETPEEFLLAKPQEQDVEDEMEGDFKCGFIGPVPSRCKTFTEHL